MFRNLTTWAAMAAIGFVGFACEKPEPTEGAQAAEAVPADAGQAAPKAAKAPDFALEDHHGKLVRLSDLAGKMVVLEWTNPTCPFVKRHYQAGTVKALAAKYAAQGVVWLAIDSSRYATHEAAKAWASRHQLPYQILNDRTGKVGRAYRATNTPHMFIIDKAGRIAYQGAIDDKPAGPPQEAGNYVDQALTELLAGKAVSVAKTSPYGCTVKYAN